MTAISVRNRPTALRLSVRLATPATGRSQTVSLTGGSPVRVKLAA